MKIKAIEAAKLILRVLYFFMKLRPQKNQICMLSRESDTEPVDFMLLREELSKIMPEMKTVTYCELLSSTDGSPVRVLKNTLKSMALLSVSRCCVLDTYSLPVSVLKHRKNFTVVQVWHALGGLKLSGYCTLDRTGGHSAAMAKALSMHRNYTFITAAGERAAKLYSIAFDCSTDIILKLGMPRIDYILSESEIKKQHEAAIKEKYPELFNGKKTILYVPTFRADGGIKLDEMLDIIDFSYYNLAVKAHVIDKSDIKADGVTFIPESIFDIFGLADYIITDYSAAAIEASLTGKPLLFYVYDIDSYLAERGLYINPLEELPELSSKSFKELYKIIDGEDYPEEARLRFRDSMVETRDTHNTRRIAEKIRETLNSDKDFKRN